MPDENKEKNVSDANLPIERSDKFIKIYSNNAALAVTPFDFVLTFGEVNRRPDKTYVEQTVSVSMSPQHAKALAFVLLNNVSEYEKHVGQIPLPQGEAPTPEGNGASTPTKQHNVTK